MRSVAPPSSALAHASVVGVLILAGGLAIRSIVQSLRDRDELEVLLGSSSRWMIALAWLSAAVCIAALAVRVRDWRRGRPARPATLRAALCVTVLAAAVYLVFFQPFKLPVLDFFAGIAAGILSLWALVEVRVASALGPRTIRAFDALLFSLCLAAPLTELSLRGYAVLRPSAVFARTTQRAAQIMERLRRPPGEMLYGFPCNSTGHYDEEFLPKSALVSASADPARERLVVSIGDSFSLSSVPHYYNYTTVCERLLPGTRVYNMGIAAVGPPEYLLMMCEEAIPLAPDLIVIGLFLGNDVGFLGSRAVTDRSWLRSWFDRDNLYLYLVPRRIGRIARERRAIGGADRTIGGAGGERATSVGRIDDLDELAKHLPWLRNPELEQPGFTREGYLAIQWGRAIAICEDKPEVFGPFFRELQKIIDAAGTTPLAFLLIPDEFQVDDVVWADVVGGLPDHRLERDLAQRLVKAWLDERGVPYLDLLPKLRAAETGSDGRHMYLLRNTHWSVRGNEIGGQGQAELITSVLGEAR